MHSIDYLIVAWTLGNLKQKIRPRIEAILSLPSYSHNLGPTAWATSEASRVVRVYSQRSVHKVSLV